MVSHLLEGLADYQSQSSSGACVVLNGIVKTRMTALLPKVYNYPHATYSVEYYCQPWDIVFAVITTSHCICTYSVTYSANVIVHRQIYFNYAVQINHVWILCTYIHGKKLAMHRLHPSKKLPPLRIYGSYHKLLT